MPEVSFSSLSRGAAYLLAAILTFLLPTVLLTFNLQKHLMAAEPYKAAFSQQGLYRQIPELLAGQVIDGLSQDPAQTGATAPQLFGFLDEKELTLILEEMVSEDWSQMQVEDVIEALFAFLNGETERLEFTISLIELKTALSGPQSQKIFDLMIASMPPCTAADLEAVIFSLLAGGEFQLPICALPGEIMSMGEGIVQKLLAPLIDNVPAAISVSLSQADFEVPNPDQPGQTSNLVDDYRTLRRLFQRGPQVVIVLFVLIALLAVRSWRGLLRWWGWPLFLGSGIVFLPLLFFGNQIVSGIEDYVFLRAPAAFSVEIVNTFTEIVGQIATGTFATIGVQAVILISAGFAVLVVDFLIGRRAATDDQATAA
jgi:hypothetical protein